MIARVLDVEVASVSNNTSPDNVENWDSFNGLVLVTELEKKFKVKFTVEEIISVKNVGDIRRVLKKHGVLT
ncbi:MAG: acyl carrier protein [Patescibacteria group bacterium]